MGDYAEMEIEREIWGRYSDHLDYGDRPTRPQKPKSNPTHQCGECGHWCRGEVGLKMHMRDKHDIS